MPKGQTHYWHGFQRIWDFQVFRIMEKRLKKMLFTENDPE